MLAAAVPVFPPRWAETFGEDDFGVFAAHTLSGVRFVWRWIPPGRFLMGSPETEAVRWSDEGPRHEVTITRGFWLGDTPVTQAQWQALSGDNPSYFKRENRPVERVSWEDAASFAERLGVAVPGLHPGLPTEAQWEYACRAGTDAAYHDGSPCTQPEGDDPALDALGWYGGNSSGQTHGVRQKRPNAWGLYDLHGNVWEWCRDGWSEYRPGPVEDPVIVPKDNSAPRVVRGGSWVVGARGCRAAYRYHRDPDLRSQSRGFRLAAGQELPAEPPS